jgi:hypothetical protein
MNRICGYQVVRKPKCNYDELGRGAYSNTAPCIGETYYSGVDRMAWFDLDEDYYSGTISKKYADLRSDVEDYYTDFSGFKLLPDLEKTIKILNYSNKDIDRNEICVLYSEELALKKGVIMTDKCIDWLGSDIFVSGYGSILLLGIYSEPLAFADFLAKLNKNGLFDIELPIHKKYIARYCEVCASYNLEPVNFTSTRFMSTIAVGRLII